MAGNRRGERVKCSIACEVTSGSESGSGAALDISNSGLAVVSSVKTEEGGSVTVRLRPIGQQPITVEAIVFGLRRVRFRSGDRGHRLSLMVSNPPAEFHDLFEKLQERTATTLPAAEDERDEDDRTITVTGIQIFHAHLKQIGSSQTRTIAVNASSPEQAKKRAKLIAMSKMGGLWRVTDVVKA